jgi:hypothetical protein
MSRRVISLALAVALTATMIPLQGCQLLQKAGVGGSTAQPFTLDYQLKQADYDFFVGSDTVDTAIVHSPFYPGNQPLPSQNTADYENARWEKVKAIIADADALVTAAKAAEPALTAVRSDYITLLEKVRTGEPKASAFVGSSVASVTALATQEILASTAYESLKSTEATTAYASTMRDYLRVTRALEYAALMLEDWDTLILHAGTLTSAIEVDGSAAAKTAVAEFDAKAEKDVAAAAAVLDPLAAGMDRVDQGMTHLASGDYYFSREALGWMASETAKLKPQVDALAARTGVTQDQVDDIKTMFGAVEQWNAALTSQLGSLDTSGLVAVSGAAPLGVMPWVDVAYAAEGAAAYLPGADYSAAVAAMKTQPASKTSLLGATWSGIKNVFGKAKTGLGVGLDIASVATRNIATAGFNYMNGIPRSETWKQWKQNVKEIGKNYDAGVSGAQVFTDATGFLDAAEAGAGKYAGGWAKSGVESKWGKGKVADTVGWATDGLVKITTGMFTGLAKGIYKVASKGSSTADVASGFVEIALGSIGGSKVLVKATQVPGLLKGGYQGLKNVGKVFVNLAQSAGDAKVKAALTAEMAALLANNKLTKEAVTKLISNSVKVEMAEAIAGLMTRNRDLYIKTIRNLIASGASGLKTNFVGGIKSSLEDLVSKSFAKSLQGFLDAGTTVIGAGLGDYIDNLVGSQLDPILTDLINTALSIPPDPEQVDGTYTGAFIVTKVDIPPEYTKEAKDANCAAIFKQLEGKKQAMTLKVSATGGTATLTSGKSTQKGAFEYSGGAVSMSFASNGTTMSFKGTAKLTKEGVTMGGGFSMPYPKTKIMISGTWSVTKK